MIKKIAVLGMFLFLVCVLVTPAKASAATYYWTGAGGASINVATNWSTTTNAACGVTTGGAVPSTTDTAIFDSVCTHSASVDTTWSVAGLTMGTGYSGTITQASVSTVIVGANGFSQAAGAFVSDPSITTFSSTTNFTLTGGTFNRFTGAGSIGSPYLVYDIYGLQGMTDFLSSGLYFNLNNDIDATIVSGWNSGAGFVPIGGTFQGNFNGQNHTISSLSIIRPGQTDNGLFGNLGGGTLQNLTISNISLSGGVQTGALFGSGGGTITNVHVTGIITLADGYSGGALIGTATDGSQISNCSFEGTINATDYTGVGLVGINQYFSVISNSWFNGTINVHGASFGVGGVTGALFTGGAEVHNSYAAGVINVDSGSNSVGGLVGVILNNPGGASFQEYKVISSYSSMTINAPGNTFVGGLVGKVADDAQLNSITDSYASGAVNAAGSTDVGGLVGITFGTTISNSYSTGLVSAVGGTNVGGWVGYNKGTGHAFTNNAWYTSSSTNAIGLDDHNTGAVASLVTAGYGYDVASLSSLYGSSHSVYTVGAAWNFTTPWVSVVSSFPYLIWQVAPTTTTGVPTFVTATTVTLGGNITATGGAALISRGINYGLTTGYGSTSPSDTGSFSTGAFTESITGLTQNTVYNYQATATNLAGAGVGSNATFTTLASTPTSLTASGMTTTNITLSTDTFINSTVGTSGYYFSNSTNGNNSGWIQSNSWQDTNLRCGTSYSYTVKYRNQSSVETGTTSASQSTNSCPGGGIVIPVLVTASNGDKPLDFGITNQTGKTITLSLNANPTTVKGYIVSTIPDFSDAQSIQPYTNNPMFALPDTNSHTIYLKYYSTTGSWSQVIQHDTTGTLTNKTVSTIISQNTFTRTLKLGSTGADVKALQQFLNTHGFVIATSGAGSFGHETMLFGLKTKIALIKFQEANANKILAPNGLRKGTGTFGPATMQVVNGMFSQN